MLSPLIEVLTVLQTLYKLGTNEQGEGLLLKQEDFYSHKLMNKITKQLQVCCIQDGSQQTNNALLWLCVTRTPWCCAAGPYPHGVTLYAQCIPSWYSTTYDRACSTPPHSAHPGIITLYDTRTLHPVQWESLTNHPHFAIHISIHH